MFVLRTTAGKFYNGRAGDMWLSDNLNQAFAYGGEGEASRKAANFNRMTALHGHTFEVVPVKPGNVVAL